jgi:hypothetical protein
MDQASDLQDPQPYPKKIVLEKSFEVLNNPNPNWSRPQSNSCGELYVVAWYMPVVTGVSSSKH